MRWWMMALATGCIGSGTDASVECDTGCGDPDPPTSTGPLVPFAACPIDNGYYELLTASIAGDVLTADVSYGGGCESHEWALCWDDQAFQSGDPAVARLSIAHQDHGDTCDLGYPDAAMDFSLTPLKDAWIADGGEASATLRIELDGIPVDWSF